MIKASFMFTGACFILTMAFFEVLRPVSVLAVSIGPMATHVVCLTENIHNATFLPYIAWFVVGNALCLFAAASLVNDVLWPAMLPFTWTLIYFVVPPFQQWYDRIQDV